MTENASAAKAPTDKELVFECVDRFLDAVSHGRPWQPFGQVSQRGSLVTPLISAFDGHEICALIPVRGHSEVQRRVTVKIKTIGGPNGQEWLKGSLSVVRENEEGAPDAEGEWGVCPMSWRWLEWQED